MMSDKMTKDQALDVIDDVAALVGTSAFEDVKALDLVIAFKKALSQSEPAQVIQPVYAYDVPIEGDAGSTELAYAAWYRRNPLPDNAIPLFTSQPDYEALKLRVAELEAATEHLGLTPQQAKDGLSRHKALVTERGRLQSECGLLERKLRIVLNNVPATVRTRLDMQMAEMRVKVREE